MEEFQLTVKQQKPEAIGNSFLLWNIHILQLKTDPNKANLKAFYLNDLAVTDCQIEGVVCDKHCIGKSWVVYTVDDGTAVIPVLCSYDSNKIQSYIHEEVQRLNINHTSLRLEYSEDQTKLLSKMLSKIKANSCIKFTTKFDVGDTIQVEGHVKLFKDNLQIVASRAINICDLNQEIARTKRVLHFYHKFIDVHLGLAKT